MIDDILNAIPEEKKAALKPSLDKLVDVESLTAEQFADLLKTNTALNSIYQAELSRKNDRYAKEKVPELVKRHLLKSWQSLTRKQTQRRLRLGLMLRQTKQSDANLKESLE